MKTATRQQARPRRTAVPHYRGRAVRLQARAGAPDPADLGAVRRWVRASARPTAIDLFAGAGGLSLGLREAGFSVLVGADSDPWAVETHSANVGGLGFVGDLADPTSLIERLHAWGIRTADLVAGGPPCQPFSRAGSSKIRSLVRAGARIDDDPRAGLWRGFMTVVEELRPRAVLVENVPELPRWDDGAVLAGFYESLRELVWGAESLSPASWGIGPVCRGLNPSEREHIQASPKSVLGRAAGQSPSGGNSTAVRRVLRPA